MKHTHGSVALAGLLALALVLAGCASQNERASGSSGVSGSMGSSNATGETASSPAVDDGGYALGSTGNSYNTGSSAQTVQEVTATSSGASGAAGATGSGNARMQDDRGNAAATSRAKPPSVPANSTVLAIEIIPASSSITEGDSSMNTSGGTGTTASTASGQSYRVTVRMDDGSTQVVTHNNTPEFRSGDRVHVKGGAIVR